MAVVVFDPRKFRLRYPGFSDEEKVPDEVLEMLFDEACEIVDNDDDLIPYDPDAKPPVRTREVLLYMIVCHIATMTYLWEPGQAGALTSATEGSVSAGFNVVADAQNPAWWTQTQCGATAWMMLKRYLSGVEYVSVDHLYVNG